MDQGPQRTKTYVTKEMWSNDFGLTLMGQPGQCLGLLMVDQYKTVEIMNQEIHHSAESSQSESGLKA